MEVANTRIVSQISATVSFERADGSRPTLDYTQGKFQQVPADADLLFSNAFDIASGANLDIDLVGGVEDQFGNAITFAKVYGILVINNATEAGHNIAVGGSTNSVPLMASATQAISPVGPGAVHLSNILPGWTVTAGTGDILRVSNIAGGESINVTVAVLGKA